MPRDDASQPKRRHLSAGWPILLCAALMVVTASGCVNMGVMFGKVLFGDPMIASVFEQRTGVSLAEEGKRIAVVCTAPTVVTGEFDTLPMDLQSEVSRRMRMHKLNVLRDDDVISALNTMNGSFDREALALALPDADYIIHIDVERFTQSEENSPQLYRGRSNGIVYAYEVDRGPETTARPRVLQVFYQQFISEYPPSQPVPSDQMPARVFRQRCVSHLADMIGRIFYDVPTSEALE